MELVGYSSAFKVFMMLGRWPTGASSCDRSPLNTSWTPAQSISSVKASSGAPGRLRMFKYSGSKRRMIQHLPAPPPGTKTIVEPFAGSAAYGLHYRPERLVLAESNQTVRELWSWLIGEASDGDLQELQSILRKHKVAGEKFDLRNLELAPGALTLARLTTSGVYVGQLSSYVFYPQNKIDFGELRSALPYIKCHVELGPTDFSDAMKCDSTAFVFIDPPYLGTSGNYIDKSKVSQKNLDKIDLGIRLAEAIANCAADMLFTYGSDAPEAFPLLNWQLACERKVPKIRTGGTITRQEWFAEIRGVR